MESISAMSMVKAMAEPPAASMAETAASSSGLVRDAQMTVAPWEARPSAMPRPMPRPAPVTRAILPSSENMLIGVFSG